MQRGFKNVRSLDGGYRIYEALEKELS